MFEVILLGLIAVLLFILLVASIVESGATAQVERRVDDLEEDLRTAHRLIARKDKPIHYPTPPMDDGVHNRIRKIEENISTEKNLNLLWEENQERQRHFINMDTIKAKRNPENY